MPAEPRDGGDIYNASRRCEHGFRRLLPFHIVLDGNERHCQVLRDSHNRFNLWASSFGALAESTNSLDTRLRFYPGVKNAILRLTRLLGDNLTIVWIEFSSHTNSSKPPQGSRTGTDHAVTLKYVPDESAYKAVLETIEETTTRLQRLAVVVQSSSISSLALAANIQYNNIDPVPLTEFERLALLFVKGRLHGLDDGLARQLARSITFRRLSIIHSQRNQDRQIASYPPRTPKELGSDSPSAGLSRSRRKGTSLASAAVKQANQDRSGSPFAKSGEKSEQMRSQSLENLQPYVCISEYCTEPLVYFKSFMAWRGHMEDVHTTEWARQVHKPTVWYCDEDSHEYCEFNDKENLREHLDSQHKGEYTDKKYTRKLSRNTMTVPRARNICPLCNADMLDVLAQRDRQVGRRPTAKEKGLRRGRGNNNDFPAIGDISSSDDDGSTFATSKQATEKTDIVSRALSRHVASHLKSFAVLSGRYLDEDSASAKSEQAAFGSVNEGSEENKLASDFPEADGSLFFEDIARDERPAIYEPDLINTAATTSQNWSQTNRRDDHGRGWNVVAARRGTLMVLSHFLTRLEYYSKKKAKSKASEAIGSLKLRGASDSSRSPGVKTGRASSPRNMSDADFPASSRFSGLTNAALGLFRRPSKRRSEHKAMSESDRGTGHHGGTHRVRTMSIFGPSYNTHATLRSLVGATFSSKRSYEISTSNSDNLAKPISPEAIVGDNHIGHSMLAAFEDVYNDLRGTDDLLSLQSFSAFLKEVQGESEVKLDRQVYTSSEFLDILFKQCGLYAALPRAEKDLSKPMTHYFIKSCRNILGTQLGLDMYMQDAIKTLISEGYRCIELEVRNNDKVFRTRKPDTGRPEYFGRHSRRPPQISSPPEYSSLRSSTSSKSSTSMKSDIFMPSTGVHEPRGEPIRDSGRGLLDEPMVSHHQMFVHPCSFTAACEAIKESAFVDNDMPIIVVLVVFADLDQEDIMVKIMQEVWQGQLLSEPCDGFDPRFRLPTLGSLRNKILVMVKKVRNLNERSYYGGYEEPSPWDEGRGLFRVPSPSIDDVEQESLKDGRIIPSWSSRLDKMSSLHPLASGESAKARDSHSLDKLAVYTRNERFESFRARAAKDPTHVFSMSETHILRLHHEHHRKLLMHNRSYFMRAFPSGMMIDHGNPDPTLFWRLGVQMVAMNWSSRGEEMDDGMMLNESMFVNEQGWVLKPPEYWSSAKQIDMEGDEAGATRHIVDLNITMLAAQNLPMETLSSNAIPSFVKVKLHAETPNRADVNRICKLRVDTNTKNAQFGPPGQEIQFNDIPQEGTPFSFVSFKISTEKRILRSTLAWSCIRLDRLRVGYRLIRLTNAEDGQATGGELLVKISKTMRQVAIVDDDVADAGDG